jgi:hypothetical protein
MNKVLFIKRFLSHALIFLVTLPLWIFGIISLLIILPITKTYVPIWLRWFDCADHFIGRNTETIDAIIKTGWFNYYKFIALRNPLNYFSYHVLGVNCSIPGCKIISTDKEVGDNIAPGFQYTELQDSNFKCLAYLYDWIWVYKLPLTNTKKCIRFRLGWKLNGLGTGPIAQEVLVFSPFHSYTGV